MCHPYYTSKIDCTWLEDVHCIMSCDFFFGLLHKTMKNLEDFGIGWSSSQWQALYSYATDTS